MACRHAFLGSLLNPRGATTPDFRWGRMSAYLCGVECDYRRERRLSRSVRAGQPVAGSLTRSQSHHAPTPSPVVTDKGRTPTPGYTDRQCATRCSSPTSTYGRRSILLIRTRSATENICGYFSGLSHPPGPPTTAPLAG